MHVRWLSRTIPVSDRIPPRIAIHPRFYQLPFNYTRWRWPFWHNEFIQRKKDDPDKGQGTYREEYAVPYQITNPAPYDQIGYKNARRSLHHPPCKDTVGTNEKIDDRSEHTPICYPAGQRNTNRISIAKAFSIKSFVNNQPFRINSIHWSQKPGQTCEYSSHHCLSVNR